MSSESFVRLMMFGSEFLNVVNAILVECVEL